VDFCFTAEQQAVRAAIRKLVDREIAPRADGYDRTGEYPRENLETLAEHGYMGMLVPEEYGGAGADFLTYALCVEEISRGCASTGVIFEVHCSLHCDAIVRFGTEDQKRERLPDLAAGRRIGAFAVTEPDAGSDVSSVSTRAELTGDHYVVNGRKMFITSGGAADSYLVLVVTDPAKGKKGMSVLLVDKDAPGMSFGPPEDKMGIRASRTTEIIFEDCRVPVGNLLRHRRAGRGDSAGRL